MLDPDLGLEERNQLLPGCNTGGFYVDHSCEIRLLDAQKTLQYLPLPALYALCSSNEILSISNDLGLFPADSNLVANIQNSLQHPFCRFRVYIQIIQGSAVTVRGCLIIIGGVKGVSLLDFLGELLTFQLRREGLDFPESQVAPLDGGDLVQRIQVQRFGGLRVTGFEESISPIYGGRDRGQKLGLGSPDFHPPSLCRALIFDQRSQRSDQKELDPPALLYDVESRHGRLVEVTHQVIELPDGSIVVAFA